MKNIQLKYDGRKDDFIVISFEENERIETAKITEPRAVEAIMVLGEALYKNTFIKK